MTGTIYRGLSPKRWGRGLAPSVYEIAHIGHAIKHGKHPVPGRDQWLDLEMNLTG